MKAVLLLVGLFAIISIGQAITLKEMDNKIAVYPILYETKKSFYNSFEDTLNNYTVYNESIIDNIDRCHNEMAYQLLTDIKTFLSDEELNIIREVLSNAPELVINFDRGKATSWTKHKVGEKAEKRQEKKQCMEVGRPHFG